MSKALTPKTFNEKDLAFIKANIAKNATDEELNLFITRCKALGLNPLKPGQIFFQKYKNKHTGEWYPGVVIVGRDGLRALAARTGKHRGTKTGPIKENGKIVGGWAEVYRAGWDQPARVEVPLSEYFKNTDIWRELPGTMIQKVAECAALRMAFPDELEGLYSEDERIVGEDTPSALKNAATALPEPSNERPEFESVIEVAPKADPPVTQSVYIFKTGGSRKGKAVDSFNTERLNAFIGEVDKLVTNGKNVSQEVQDDYDAAVECLITRQEKNV